MRFRLAHSRFLFNKKIARVYRTLRATQKRMPPQSKRFVRAEVKSACGAENGTCKLKAKRIAKQKSSTTRTPAHCTPTYPHAPIAILKRCLPPHSGRPPCPRLKSIARPPFINRKAAFLKNTFPFKLRRNSRRKNKNGAVATGKRRTRPSASTPFPPESAPGDSAPLSKKLNPAAR